LDLSKATIVWLSADFGVDLTAVTLPADGSCLVITDRLRAIDAICEGLSHESGELEREVARVLQAIYSERSISPKEASQTTFLISHGMIAELAETHDEPVVRSLFERIRAIAEEGGFLGANR
jgi:hypothetical protein